MKGNVGKDWALGKVRGALGNQGAGDWQKWQRMGELTDAEKTVVNSLSTGLERASGE